LAHRSLEGITLPTQSGDMRLEFTQANTLVFAQLLTFFTGARSSASQLTRVPSLVPMSRKRGSPPLNWASCCKGPNVSPSHGRRLEVTGSEYPFGCPGLRVEFAGCDTQASCLGAGVKSPVPDGEDQLGIADSQGACEMDSVGPARRV
jgi:hypothetical protein